MFYHERQGRFILLISLLYGGVTFVLLGSFTSTAAQVGEPTATPDAEGVIYVVVRPNDSLWGIATSSGISFQELLALNNLTEDAIIQPGQQLIIGYGSPPPTATVEQPTPTVTATRPPPTPTQTAVPPPRTAICIKAFSDMDRDGVHDAEESLKVAVAFTIFNDEMVVDNYITDGVSEPYCLEGLVPGDYKVTRSISPDETLTTTGNWSLTLTQGSVLFLDFGSYTGVEGVEPDNTVSITPAGLIEEEVVNSSEPSNLNVDDNNSTSLFAVGIIVGLIILLTGGLFWIIRAQLFKSEI